MILSLPNSLGEKQMEMPPASQSHAAPWRPSSLCCSSPYLPTTQRELRCFTGSRGQERQMHLPKCLVQDTAATPQPGAELPAPLYLLV